MRESATPNDVCDFMNRFEALQLEAKQFGITSIVAIHENDPISREDVRWSSYVGGLITCIGMAQCMLAKMVSKANEDQIHEEG